MEDKWQVAPDSLRLFKVVNNHEVSTEALNGCNRVEVIRLPQREVLESVDVKGTTIEDGERAMRLARQLVKQIQKSH